MKETMFVAIYRLSTNGYAKEKFSYATKLYCLENFLREFYISGEVSPVHLLIDTTNLNEEVHEQVRQIDPNKFNNIHYYAGGSSAASWREGWNYLFNLKLPDNTICLLSEDDYLYTPNSLKTLLEGTQRGIDYIAPYLHGDRFIPAGKGGNQHVDDSGTFLTRFFKTHNKFWIMVESTTMTFCTTMKTLKEDEEIWEKYTMGTHPNDYLAFLELTQKKYRSLASPVPTIATHCEPMWESPLIGTPFNTWSEV